MNLMIPSPTELDAPSFLVSLSFQEIEFLKHASDFYCAMLNNHSDVADFSLLFSGYSKSINRLYDNALNWLGGDFE